MDLAGRATSHPRLATLAAIKAAVLQRLPGGRLRPADLAAAAREGLRHAPAVLGSVETRGITALEPVWEGVLADLAAAA